MIPQAPLEYRTAPAPAVGGNRIRLAYGYCVAGILVTPVAGVTVVCIWAAGYSWQWFNALLFPYAMALWLWGVGSQDLLIIIALAPFPLYGLILAGASLVTRPALTMWSRILGLAHLLAAGGCAASIWARGG